MNLFRIFCFTSFIFIYIFLFNHIMHAKKLTVLVKVSIFSRIKENKVKILTIVKESKQCTFTGVEVLESSSYKQLHELSVMQAATWTEVKCQQRKNSPCCCQFSMFVDKHLQNVIQTNKVFFNRNTSFLTTWRRWRSKIVKKKSINETKNCLFSGKTLENWRILSTPLKLFRSKLADRIRFSCSKSSP